MFRRSSRVRLIFAPSLTVAVLLCIGAADAGEKKLFNGTNLDGWEGRSDLWSVEDGAITGRTVAENPLKNNTFLVWKAGTVGDFELTLKYRIVDGNSGIQYRSQVVSQNEETGPIVGGYQADFEAGDTYSGILYEERGRGILAKRGEKTVVTADPENPEKHQVEVVGSTGDSEEIQAAIRPEEWNEYRIVAKGNHLQHYINGHLTVDVADKHEAAAQEGVLAFQCHVGPPMTVQFKDIVLKTAE